MKTVEIVKRTKVKKIDLDKADVVKLVKMLCVCVWMVTRVAQILTAAHRDCNLASYRPTNEP